MTTVAELKGSRIVEAGEKGSGDILAVDDSRMLLWLVDGESEWIPETGEPERLQAGEQIRELAGPGVLRFITRSHYVRLEPGDELGFDARARAYHAVMEERNQDVGLALAEGLPVSRGQIWVDIGTGTGAMVHALQEHAATQRPIWIVGVDRASKMIDEAWHHQREEAPAWYVGRDLLRVKWPDGMFDGITALLLLHLVDDINLLLDRVYHALKPGGLFAYAVSADANPFVRMIMHQLSGPGDFFKQGQHQIRESILATGFEIERDDIYRDEIVMDNPEAMLQLIGSIGAPGRRGVRSDVLPPQSVERVFNLVWAKKPIHTVEV